VIPAKPITIAGAGLIGASIAWRLAQAGAVVRLFDSGRVGGEASWAGAGMLAPGSEFLRQSQWTELALESLDEYPGYVEELRQESGLEIDYIGCGAIEYPAAPEDWPGMRERGESQRAYGLACEVGENALRYPRDAVVDPRQVMGALAEACRRRGVEIHEGAPLNHYDTQGAPLVIAAGAWSGRLAITENGKRVPLPETVPVKGHLLGYRLEPGTLSTILRQGHTYVLQRSNGYTVAGSNEEWIGFDREIHAKVVADIAKRAAKLCPLLEGREHEDAWCGFRPQTKTGALALGRVEGTSVWLAYGHYRNGILMAPSTARRIAGELTAG
jgi:glycine oxidase